MNKVMMTAAAMVLAAGTAGAWERNFDFVGSTEYAFDADQIETKIGVGYDVGNFTFAHMAIATYDSTNDFDFTGVEMNAMYSVSASVDAYGKLELTDQFEYSEFTVGVGYRF